MKFKKTLALLLLIPALVGCNNTKNDGSSVGLPSIIEEPIVTLEEDEDHIITKGSCGGMLLDILNDFYMEENGVLGCTYSTSLSDKTMRVVSSRPESMTVEITGTNSFNLLTHKPGDSLLTIYDADGIIEFNKVVHVRKAYTPENILDKVCDNDIYVSTGIYGNYRFAISEYSKAQVMATISGGDVGEASKKAIFELKYNDIADYSPFDSHFYEFVAIQDKTYSTSEREIKIVMISKCADQLLAYYGNDYELLEAFRIK